MAGIEDVTTKEIITFSIAALGIILAGFTLVRSIVKERRRISVEISPAFFTYADGSISSQMASIDVVNRGRRPAVVNAPALRMPDGKFVFFTDADGFGKFPKRLEDGEKASIVIAAHRLISPVEKYTPAMNR